MGGRGAEAALTYFTLTPPRNSSSSVTTERWSCGGLVVPLPDGGEEGGRRPVDRLQRRVGELETKAALAVAVADQVAQQLGSPDDVQRVGVDVAQPRIEQPADVARTPQERVAEAVAHSAVQHLQDQ